MILRIVAPLVASVGTAVTLKQDLCVSARWLPPFSMACCRCNLFPGRNRISIAFCNDGELDLSLGLVREVSVDFGVLSNHSPPTSKGKMFAMRQPGLSPPGG